MNRLITRHTPHGSLRGWLERPELPHGLILIVRPHLGPADSAAASELASRRCAVLVTELLTASEIAFADATHNVPRLTQRLIDVLDLIRSDGDMEQLPLGVFATGDIAPAAIRAAAQRDSQVDAVACHGGLIDRAGGQALDLLLAPLLILLDADDEAGLTASRRANAHLHNDHEIRKLPPGEGALPLAANWLAQRLGAPSSPEQAR